MSQILLANNLTLVARRGTEAVAVKLTPTQSFKLAEKLLRNATREIVRVEAAAGVPPLNKETAGVVNV